jgi:hypothetical protein
MIRLSSKSRASQLIESHLLVNEEVMRRIDPASLRTRIQTYGIFILSQAIKTIEAFAHIATVDQQKDFQAPAEVVHRFAPSRPSNSAAKVTSAVLLV